MMDATSAHIDRFLVIISSSDSDHNGDVERGGMRANGYVMHGKETSSRAFTRDELEAAADRVDKVLYH